MKRFFRRVAIRLGSNASASLLQVTLTTVTTNDRKLRSGIATIGAYSTRCVPCRVLRTHFCRANAKTPAFRAGVLGLGSLTITYFHTGIRTIIGVESFHGPVRDGK
ncbi:hypothetical protein BSLA_01r0435, partial [Burkholderia stabilis]